MHGCLAEPKGGTCVTVFMFGEEGKATVKLNENWQKMKIEKNNVLWSNLHRRKPQK